MAHQPPLSEKREAQLIDLARAGDRGAMGELLTAYHRQVYHVCLRMVSHAEDAADLTQDTLLKAAKNLDSFRGGSRFRTWLFRIAMNQSISHLRKRKVRMTVSLDQPVESDGGLEGTQAGQLRSMIAEDREPGPDQSVETNEQIAIVLAAVDRLDESLKAVILLRDLQDMDYQQIADVLNIPVGTVKSRLFQARLALRAELAQREGKTRKSSNG